MPPKLKIAVHGAGQEVGRSCFVINNELMLDAGLKISEEGSEYPKIKRCGRIKAVFISHAHLDHTGALPMFNHWGLDCPIYTNWITRDISKVLMRDSLHIELLSKQFSEYSKANIKNIISQMQNIRFNRKINQDGLTFEFLYAGHIPGAASVLLDYKGWRILYTGDINNCETRLLAKSSYKLKGIDLMICESTYGNRNHKDRAKEEQDFLDEIEAAIRRGGSVLIPVFAVGRAQEIAMVLAQREWNVPIYMDGMAKEITKIMKRYPESIRNSFELDNALSKVEMVKNYRQRMQITGTRGIFITTSGMIDGGPVLEYLKHFYFSEKNALLLTGYQAEGSGGRHLLDTGKIFIDGNMLKVRCKVQKFDFSAHSGRKELISLVRRIKPRHLLLEHGDQESVEALSQAFSGMEEDMSIYVPKTGEIVKLIKH